MAKEPEETTENEDQPQEGKAKKSKAIPAAIIIAVALLGAAFMLKSSMGGGSSSPTTTVEEASGHSSTTAAGSHSSSTKKDDKSVPLNFTIPASTVNISGGRYLKVGVTLVMPAGGTFGEGAAKKTLPAAGAEGKALEPFVAEFTPEVNDMILTTLQGADSAYLSTPQGREQARSQLQAQLDEHFGMPVEVLFTTFVVA